MDIERRLERVERRLRIFQGITAAVIILLGAVIIREAAPGAQAGSEPQAIPEKIQARAFEVVNPDGVIVARLSGGIFDSGDLVLNGYSKPFSLIRSVQIYGAGIAFHSKIIDPSVDMSQILVTIGADDRGGLFAIYNNEEKLSVGASATAGGDGEIMIADRSGRPLVRIGADGEISESAAERPAGRLNIYDSERRAAVTLRANTKGKGILELSE